MICFAHRMMQYVFDFLERWKVLITLLLFINTYLWVGIGHGRSVRLDRTGFALLGGITMLTFGCITFEEAINSIDFHTIALVFSLMVISAQLHYAGFYRKIGERLDRFLHRPMLLMLIVMMTGAIASSFSNNSVVALAFAPLLASVLIKHRMNPVPYLLALCMANNGCLTIIGNPQNVVVAQLGHISFIGYAVYAFVPVMLCCLACFGICWFLSRHFIYLPADFKGKDDITLEDEEYSKSGTIKGLGALVILIFCFIFTDWDRGIVSLTLAGGILCSQTLSSRQILSRVDWQTILLFIGLFVIVGAFNINGLGEQMVKLLDRFNLNLNDPLVMTLASAGLSNMINNAAAVMLLGNVVDLQEHVKTAYALAMSNALGGNMILVGSLSNLMMIQIAHQAGLKITFKVFFKYGLPCTLVSLGILSGWLYFV